MAFYDTTWYCNAGDQSTTGYYAVAKRPQNTAVVAGQIVRQFTAPAVGSERCFVCIIAGTTANVADATWVLTRGAKTTDGTATWMEVTGTSAMNGDLANTPTWQTHKINANAGVLGNLIKRSNGASYQICTTAGSALAASEPTFSDTAGVTTADGATVVWTSLGPIANFTGGMAPHARLANACAANWFAVGNTVYIADNHAESQATAITITPTGSGAPASLGKFLCHNHSGSYPPASTDLMTGATISTTAAVSITFNPSGATYYVYGIAFVAGVGGAFNAFVILGPNSAFYYFDKCLFKLAGTVASSQITLNGTAAGIVIWNNCTVYFGNVGQYIDIGATNFTWQNTGPILASGSLVPTGFMGEAGSARQNNVVLEALDLSQLTGSLDKQAAIFEAGNWLIKDCKLNSAMTIPTPQAYGQTIQLVRSDS